MMVRKILCKAALIIPFVLFSIIPCLISFVLLRNLGTVIGAVLESEPGAKFDFARIFGALEHASIIPHWIVPFLLGAGLFLLCRFTALKLKHKPLRAILIGMTALILFCVSVVCSLLFTSVNGIRFCDLLGELIPIIDKL